MRPTVLLLLAAVLAIGWQCVDAQCSCSTTSGYTSQTYQQFAQQYNANPNRTCTCSGGVSGVCQNISPSFPSAQLTNGPGGTISYTGDGTCQARTNGSTGGTSGMNSTGSSNTTSGTSNSGGMNSTTGTNTTGGSGTNSTAGRNTTTSGGSGTSTTGGSGTNTTGGTNSTSGGSTPGGTNNTGSPTTPGAPGTTRPGTIPPSSSPPAPRPGSTPPILIPPTPNPPAPRPDNTPRPRMAPPPMAPPPNNNNNNNNNNNGNNNNNNNGNCNNNNGSNNNTNNCNSNNNNNNSVTNNVNNQVTNNVVTNNNFGPPQATPGTTPSAPSGPPSTPAPVAPLAGGDTSVPVVQPPAAASPPADCGVQPQCRIFTENKLCCQDQGIVSEAQYSSTWILCTHTVQLPQTCLSVGGPSGIQVAPFFTYGTTGTDFNYGITWNSTFIGQVTIDIQTARASRPECTLNITPCVYQGQTVSTVAPVDNLVFSAINPTTFELGYVGLPATNLETLDSFAWSRPGNTTACYEQSRINLMRSTTFGSTPATFVSQMGYAVPCNPAQTFAAISTNAGTLTSLPPSGVPGVAP